MHVERELKVNMSGDDVATLQSELAQLGLTVLADEVQKRRFGKGTQEAVKKFQVEHGLQPNGVVDQRTADEINAAVAAAQAKTLVISGHVRKADGAAVAGSLVRAFEVASGSVLGEARTGADGSYRLQWQLEAGSHSKDLRVRAFKEDGTTTLASRKPSPAYGRTSQSTLPYSLRQRGITSSKGTCVGSPAIGSSGAQCGLSS